MADLEPTYYNVGKMSDGGMNHGDIVRALYNVTQAIVAICNNLDEDNGTIGTDYLSKIGTDLSTAMAKLAAPAKGPVT